MHSHADVRVSPDDEATVRFQKYVSNGVSVIEASADRPMKAANGSSSTTDVYVLCLKQGRLQASHSGGKLVLNAGQFIVFQGRHALEVMHEQPFALLGIGLRGNALARRLPDWNSLGDWLIPGQATRQEPLEGAGKHVLPPGKGVRRGQVLKSPADNPA